MGTGDTRSRAGLQQAPGVKVENLDPVGNMGWGRFNHIVAPSNNPLVRRAAMKAVNQEDYLRTAIGNPELYKVNPSIFPVGTPLQNDAGAELIAQNLNDARTLLQQAGYFADRPLPPEQMVAGAAGAFPNAASPAEGRGSGQPAPVTSAATAESGLSEVNRTTSPAAQTLPPALRPSAPAEPSATEPATLSVLHLHRLGHCQGRLIIARDVVSFVPDENTNSDVFEFAYGEFLHTVDESTLTIRSHTRTYRFKPVTGVGRNDGVLTLAQVGAAITRFRRGVSRVRERADDAGAYGRGLN